MPECVLFCVFEPTEVSIARNLLSTLFFLTFGLQSLIFRFWDFFSKNGIFQGEYENGFGKVGDGNHRRKKAFARGQSGIFQDGGFGRADKRSRQNPRALLRRQGGLVHDNQREERKVPGELPLLRTERAQQHELRSLSVSGRGQDCSRGEAQPGRGRGQVRFGHCR